MTQGDGSSFKRQKTGNKRDNSVKAQYRAKRNFDDITIDASTITLKQTNALKVEYVNIGMLSEAEYNPRLMSNEQMEKLCKGIAEFGFVNPIVVNTVGNVIVGGHQRVKAAKILGMQSVPVAWVTLSKNREKALNIALNRISGEWEVDSLCELLKDIDLSKEVDMSLTGFTEEELELLIDKPRLLGEEDVATPEVSDPFVERGDIWVSKKFGHRFMCGDCTDKKDIQLLFDGNSADMVWTDPPYNVDYAGKNKFLNANDSHTRCEIQIQNDNFSTKGQFVEFLCEAFLSIKGILKLGGCFYVACIHGEGQGHFLDAIKNASGLKTSQVLVWLKNNFTLGRVDYNYIHEPIIYGWKEGAPHYFNGDFSLNSAIRDQNITDKRYLLTLKRNELINIINEMTQTTPQTVIRVDKPQCADLHPTMKPVRLVDRCIYASSKQGEIVADIFSGSGTTWIASHKLKRRFFGMEITTGYAEASLQRYYNYSGDEPYLISNNASIPFNQVKAMRRKG